MIYVLLQYLDVIAVTVKKPDEFRYMSGQWAQVACNGLGTHEFHPFTMTSAPHEKNLTFHIRAVGPWTMNFRRMFDPAIRTGNIIPKVNIMIYFNFEVLPFAAFCELSLTGQSLPFYS